MLSLVQVAGCNCLLESAWPLPLARNLQACLTSPDAPADFALHLTSDTSLRLPDGPGTLFHLDEAGAHFTRRRGTLLADPSFHDFRLTLKHPQTRPFTGQPWLLLALWGYLAHHDGVFLHGGACLLKDRLVLLLGVEEVGKTTLARLIARHGGDRLSDEYSFLRSQDGALRAYGGPWPGRRQELEVGNEPSAICFLRHGPDNRLQRLTEPDTARRLLQTTRFFTWDQATIGPTIALLDQISEKIPAYDFAFVPDGTAVAALRDVL